MGVGYAMAAAYWTSIFARRLGLLGWFSPPFTGTKSKVESSALLRNSRMNSPRSTSLGYCWAYPAIASTFAPVREGRYRAELYIWRRTDGVTSSLSSRPDSAVTGSGSLDAVFANSAPALRERFLDACQSMIGEAKKVVGATVRTCPCSATGSE